MSLLCPFKWISRAIDAFPVSEELKDLQNVVQFVILSFVKYKERQAHQSHNNKKAFRDLFHFETVCQEIVSHHNSMFQLNFVIFYILLLHKVKVLIQNV
jgi:hypothetical protein